MLAVPFVVALVALAKPHWYPVLDMAQTELRIRDVWSSHPPLIGLPGRIGNFSRQGSHPGPISFWALSPFYRLFGASAWAMDAAAVCLNLLVVGALLVARPPPRRRAAAPGLRRDPGLPALVLRPRDPHPGVEPVHARPVVPALRARGVVGALRRLGAAAGRRARRHFCAQTHISYVALVGGLGVLALGVDGGHRVPAPRRGQVWRVASGSGCSGASGLAVLLWLPPVIQQFTGHPANISILWDYFTQTPQETIGIGEAVKLLLRHLNPVTIFTRDDGMTGSVVPGLLVGLVWVAGVVGAWKLRARSLLRLDLVLAVAGVLGIFSAARIFGYLWFYLVLWAWGIAALMVLTIGWTIVLFVARRPSVERAPQRPATWLAAALAVVVLAGTVVFTVDASDAVAPDEQPTRIFKHLIKPTVRALKAGDIDGHRPDGRYMITFTDALNIGANAYGLALELERQGLDVGLPNREVIIPDRLVHARRRDCGRAPRSRSGEHRAVAREAEHARGRVLRPALARAEGGVRAAAARGRAPVQGGGPGHARRRGGQQPVRRDLPAGSPGGAEAGAGAHARARSAVGGLRRPAGARPRGQLSGSAWRPSVPRFRRRSCSGCASLCLALPEAYEEEAWVGTRWRIRTKTFAHVLMIDRGLAAGVRPRVRERGTADGGDVPVRRARSSTR